MFTAALSTIAKRLKPPKYPSVDKYEDLQDLLELTLKKDVLLLQGTGMQK